MLDFVRLWDWCSYNSILSDCLGLRWMAKMVASFKPAKYFPASSCCHGMLPQFVQSPEYSHFAIICRVTKIPHTCSCPHDLYFIISTHLSADWALDRKLEKSVWTDRNYYSVSWVWNWGNVCSCWHWWLEQYPCWEISYLMSILFSSSSMTASICWGKCRSWPTWFEGHSTFVRNQLLIEVQGLGFFFRSIFFSQKSWIQFLYQFQTRFWFSFY